MDEFEERLEQALQNIEYDYASVEDIAIIRMACGKPKKPAPKGILEQTFEEFGKVFTSPELDASKRIYDDFIRASESFIGERK